MATAAAEFSKEVGASGKGVLGLRQSLRTANKAVMDLTLAYSQLSAEAKNSDFGREMASQLRQAEQTAAHLKDMQQDVQKRISNMASDTMIWDGAKQGIQVLSSSIQGLAGVVGMCGGDVKAFTKALTVMKGVEAAANTIIGIGNALQKQSALMVALRAIKTKILTTATEEATVAQAANNAVTLANPYVLATVAIVGLTAAIVAWCSTTEEATELQKAQEAQTKRNKEMQQEWGKAVADSAAEQLAKYNLLQQKWNECNGSVKLQGQFLKDYASEIKDVTGKQLDLISAEDIFVKKTNEVVAAIKARAEAEAAKDLYIKAYKKKLENDYNGTVANGRYVANVHRQLGQGRNSATGTEMQAYEKATGKRAITGGGGQSGQGYVLTKEAQQWIQKRREADAKAIRDIDNAEVEYFQDFYIQREKNRIEKERAAGINTGGSSVGKGGKGSGKTTSNKGGSSTKKTEQDVKPVAQSLEWLRNKLQQLQHDLSYGLIPEDKIDETKEKIDYLKKDIEKKEIELGFKVVPVEGSLEDLNNQINQLRSDLSQGLIPDEKIDDTLEQIDNLEKKAKAKKIQIGIDPAPVTDYEKRIDQYVSEYNNYLKQQAIYEQNNLKFAAEKEKHTKHIEEETKKINDDFKNGLITLEQYNAAMDKLNDEIIEFNIKASDAAEAVQSFAFTNKSMDNIARHLEEQIQDIEKELNENDLSVEARLDKEKTKANLKRDLENLTRGELSIPAKVEIEYVEKGSVEDFRLSYDNASKSIQDIVNDYNMGIIKSVGEARSQIDEMNEKLKALGLKPIKVVLKAEWQSNIEEGTDIIHGMTDGLHNLYSTLSELPDKLDECKDSAEGFFMILDAGFSVIDTVMSFIENIQKMIEFFKGLTAAKQADTVATEANTTAQAGEAAATAASTTASISKAGANTAEAGTEAGKQMSKMGPFGWIAGIAAALAIAGALFGIISSAKGFAEGGIVGGSTTVGDKVLTRLNAGEMVLNQKQQSHLFKALDDGIYGGAAGPTTSTVRIKGDDIYLSMRNHYKRTKKSPFE